MAVNIVTCESLLSAVQSAIETATDDQKAAICEALGCGLDVDEIVSSITPNMIAVDDEGRIYVRPADMISSDENNILTVDVEGKLTVTVNAGDLANLVASELISSDANNAIVQGTDSKLLVDSTKIINDTLSVVTGEVIGFLPEMISTDADNALTTGSDDKLYVKVEDSAVAASDLISTDADNIITTGSDSKLFAKVDEEVLATSVSQMITTDGTVQEAIVSQVVANADDLISTDADNSLVQGDDGKLYVKVDTTGTTGASITWTTEDPGEGSELATGAMVFVYELSGT